MIEEDVYHEGPIIAAIKDWLGGEYEAIDYEEEEVFGNTYDELWVLPKTVEIKYKIVDDYSSQDFCWGWFAFVEYNGIRYVTEQNASPFMIYRKQQ